MGRPALLTAAAVRMIRREHNAALEAGKRPRLKRFAVRYGMDASAICQLCWYRTYKWVRRRA